MNRAMVLTLLSMAASLAAAAAAPEVDAAWGAPCLDKAVGSPLKASKTPPLAHVKSTLEPVSPCASVSDERYLRWHHGGMKLMPVCAPVVAHT